MAALPDGRQPVTGHGADDPVSGPYWRGAADGRLVLQQCGSCGRIRHYPRVLCDACHSFLVEPVDADGRGIVHSWTVAHHVFAPSVADDVPYVLVTVDLPEGVRVLGRLGGGGQVRSGLPVRITFATVDGVPVPVFVPDPAAD